MQPLMSRNENNILLNDGNIHIRHALAHTFVAPTHARVIRPGESLTLVLSY